MSKKHTGNNPLSRINRLNRDGAVLSEQVAISTPLSPMTTGRTQLPGGVFVGGSKKRAAAKLYASCLTPKIIILPTDESESARVIFNPCRMFSSSCIDGGVMHPVNHGADTLESYPPPEIVLTDDLENEIWVEWTTDGNGVVDTPSVKISTTDPGSGNAHVPASDGGGAVDGAYSQLCGLIDVPAADIRGVGVSWTPINAGLFFSVSDRDMVNVGSEAEVAKEITETEMTFRTLKELNTTPSGSYINDVFVRVDQATDTINFSGKCPAGHTDAYSGALEYEECDGTIVSFATVTNGLITAYSGPIPVGDCETPGP